MDYTPRYLFAAGERLFHRTVCEMAAGIPGPARCYSDSRESLLAQGLLPCPLCCPMGSDEIEALRASGQAKLQAHRTFEEG